MDKTKIIQLSLIQGQDITLQEWEDKFLRKPQKEKPIKQEGNKILIDENQISFQDLGLEK